MAEWPGPPAPAEPVRLPLPLPPMLLDAVGYQGGARYVALRWWGGGGGDVLWSDGSMTVPGWWPAWRLLVREHPLGRAIFAAYDLGDLHEDPAEEAPHWLLCDRWEGTLDIGLARDVEQLLRTQPSELKPPRENWARAGWPRSCASASSDGHRRRPRRSRPSSTESTSCFASSADGSTNWPPRRARSAPVSRR
jgi:hypothetical protein